MAEPPARKKYLRDRVWGYDVDEFAVEIARLSLTLTDIPNPNGWSVKVADLFESNLLEKVAKDSTILLANTPFEDFKAAQRAIYRRKFRQPQFLNKTTEILHRALSAMPPGGVFGVVAPQSLLHEANATELRKMLVEQFEIQELCLFPDRVFNFADQESAVLIGRKHPQTSHLSTSVRYRRVREQQTELFKKSYDVTSEIVVRQRRFQEAEDFDLRIPDLEQIWQKFADLPKLAEYALVGQGFSHIGEDQPDFPAGSTTVSDKRFPGAVQGFKNLGRGIQTHQLPPLKWLNISEDVVRRAICGTERGVPQILLNEAPVQRAPWCLRAMIDHVGRPAKSSFTILRPISTDISLDLLWAVLNSPVANAYAYSHSSKRNILSGTWRKFPVPKLNAKTGARIESAVHNYFDFVSRNEGSFQLRGDNVHAEEEVILRNFHWRIDAEVLRLYDLPTDSERQLLDYFAGWERVGVPFSQDHYFPQGFDEPISLFDFLAISTDWESTNSRRYELIEAKAVRPLNPKQLDELKKLQRLAGLKRELLSSPSLADLTGIEADLQRRKLWRGL